MLDRELADHCDGGALFTDGASLADMAHTGRLTETRLRPVNAAIGAAFRPGENGGTLWRNGFPRDSGAENTAAFHGKPKSDSFFRSIELS